MRALQYAALRDAILTLNHGVRMETYHLRTYLLVRQRFEFSAEAVTGVVDDHVNAAELFQRSIKCLID